MAFKYRQAFFQDGDIVDARDWNRNLTEYTEEFNGYLDRDNLPASAVTTAMIVSDACSQVETSAVSTDTTVSGEVATWQSTDGTTKFGEVSFTSDTDGLAIVEGSGTWEGNHSWTTTAGASSESYFQVRLLVDGIQVAHMPRSTFTRLLDSSYMVGVIPLPAGNHVVSIEAVTRRALGGPSGPTLTLKERELFVWLRKR